MQPDLKLGQPGVGKAGCQDWQNRGHEGGQGCLGTALKQRCKDTAVRVSHRPEILALQKHITRAQHVNNWSIWGHWHTLSPMAASGCT